MAKVGRPRKYRNEASKQKAYRERKKQAKALRNSSGSDFQESETDLKALVDHWSSESEKCKIMYTWLRENPDKDFNDWQRQRNYTCDQWWKAHQKWYDAGMPERKAKTF